jgi:hypothetical protein
MGPLSHEGQWFIPDQGQLASSHSSWDDISDLFAVLKIKFEADPEGKRLGGPKPFLCNRQLPRFQDEWCCESDVDDLGRFLMFISY